MDANILIFALTNHLTHGAAWDEFLDRVKNNEMHAVTSTYLLGDIVHP